MIFSLITLFAGFVYFRREEDIGCFIDLVLDREGFIPKKISEMPEILKFGLWVGYYNLNIHGEGRRIKVYCFFESLPISKLSHKFKKDILQKIDSLDTKMTNQYLLSLEEEKVHTEFVGINP